MATFIKIPGVNPGMERPAALTADPVLPTRGALMLVDLTHPMYAQVSGVPAHRATVPNHAWAQAAKLAEGNAAELAAIVDTAGMTGTKGKVERTAKGGIHAIFSQVNNKDAADRTHYGLVFPPALQRYLDANPDNSLYLSVWGQVTRSAQAGTGQLVSFAGIDAGTTGHRLELDSHWENLPRTDAATYLGHRGPNRRLPVGPGIHNIAAAGTAGTFRIGTTSPTERARVWAVGNTGILNTYTGGTSPAPLGASGSHILYRAYLEDLTVSGRTYAEVDALDYSYYTQECLTVGGRYYNDTFTSPSTLP